MKTYLWIVTIVFCFFACSKEESEPPLVSEDDIEVYQKTFDDAVSFMEKNSSISLEDAANYVKTLDGVINVSVEDCIIRVTTQGDVQFSIDCNTYPDYELGNLNLNKLQNYLDSIENAIGGIASGYEQTSEVFKEYISNNGSNNNYASTTTTRASSQAQVRLARRNFVIWSPYNRSDFTKEKDDVMSIVKKKTNLCAHTTRFSPASFIDLAAFDVVYMSSHGCKDGSFFLPAEYLSSTDIDEYEKEVAAKRAEKSIRRIGEKRVKGYSLKKVFFDKYLTDLGHTVIYTSACYFGADNSLFMKCCKDKNVADYFGSDNACIGADVLNAFTEFYPKLMNGYSTKMAFKNGRSSFTGSLLRGKTLETYKFKRFGEKQVGYVMPHATGTGNRSNANKAQTRGDGSDASSIIVNAQLRYTTEESGDIMNSIEAGICLQDMETKEVKLIPFSNKNMVSNEKKSYGDVTVSNIAVSLDDLTNGHKYAYCCYTKYEGIITLSDECYRIIDNYRLTIKISYKSNYYTEMVHDGKTEYSTEVVDNLGSIEILKLNNCYAILDSPSSPLFTIHYLKMGNYTIPYYTESLIYHDYSGNVQCILINDNAQIKYTLKLYDYDSQGFDWETIKVGDVTINNMDTNPSVSYTLEETVSGHDYFWSKYVVKSNISDVKIKEIKREPLSTYRIDEYIKWFKSDRYWYYQK